MDFLYAILVIASISFTITTTSIFEEIREAIAKLHPKLEQLIFCPYCLSHYVAAVLLLTSTVTTIQVSNSPVYQFLFDLFALVGGSAILHHVMLRAYEPVHKALMQRELKKLQDDGTE